MGDEFQLTPTSPEKPSRPAGKIEPDYTTAFLQFWSAYPRKEAKPKAFESWQKKGLERISARIIEHVEKRAAHDARWLKDRKYIPHPATFLNQNRWDDEYDKVYPDRPRGAGQPVAHDPYALRMGVQGMARFYHIDTTDLTEDDVCRIVWALRFGGLHAEQLRDNPLLRHRYIESLDAVSETKAAKFVRNAA